VGNGYRYYYKEETLAPELNRLHERLGEWVVLGMSVLVTGLCVLAAISYTRLGLSFIVTEEKPLDATNAPGDSPATETPTDEQH